MGAGGDCGADRIVDVVKAVYEVDDLLSALSNTAATSIKEVFGNLTFSQALESQKQINDHLAQDFARVFQTWGIQVERMELLDLQPNASTRDAMKMQMVAERRRRADYIRSEGQKTALRLQAEGAKVMKLNRGLAEQEATRKVSEGTAAAKVDLARAEAASLESLASVIRTVSCGRAGAVRSLAAGWRVQRGVHDGQPLHRPPQRRVTDFGACLPHAALRGDVPEGVHQGPLGGRGAGCGSPADAAGGVRKFEAHQGHEHPWAQADRHTDALRPGFTGVHHVCTCVCLIKQLCMRPRGRHAAGFPLSSVDGGICFRAASFRKYSLELRECCGGKWGAPLHGVLHLLQPAPLSSLVTPFLRHLHGFNILYRRLCQL